jgi:GT2 family glycosyltransferase
MKLSVIIVNYNVEHFLEQCLNSVFATQQDFDFEVIVVDNNSVDGSLEMLRGKFPQVTLIANKDNRGFSRANNQGIRIARGEYILLLNPDTVVEPETFAKTVAFMDAHPDAGGLGVKMLDGKGNFLPESKRGLPTPAAAFYKMFGLSKLFPRSKRFAAYHQGHLSKDEVHEIEVLSGAFMLMRKSVLDEVGLLDEDFFMYGEDIDLSYRIIKGGYKNYYFPETRIIHYKGESTKKNTVNYVYVFYNAMVIFAKKHYSTKNARAFSFLINSAIVFRGFLALVSGFVRALVLPLIDFALIYGGLLAMAFYWSAHKFGMEQEYPATFLYMLLPAFVLVWLFATYYSGGYDKPVKIWPVLRGALVGTLTILIIYALLPETYRFSRITVLFGALWAPLIMVSWRLLMHFAGLRDFKLGAAQNKRIAVVGDYDEAVRVAGLIEQTSINPAFTALVCPEHDPKAEADKVVGSLGQLEEIVRIYKLTEVIFCAKSLEAGRIIDLMSQLQKLKLEFKIAPPESLFIIGSNSINTSRDIYLLDLDSINKQSNKRFKRLFDFSVSLLLILLFPLHFFIFKHPLRYLGNLFLVLFGRYSMVGFDDLPEGERPQLPAIRKGILHPSDVLKREADTENLIRLNILYAREYSLSADFNIVLRGLRKADRKI